MTVTETQIDIAASPQAIYALASDTERWPEILPHYRYVRRIGGAGESRTIEMSAWRACFPITWRAVQTNDATTPRIAFKHVAGWTRGMDVTWEFEPRGATTHVRIIHHLDFQFPIARTWLEKHLVSEYFIHGVATKTLATIKTRLETTCPTATG